MGRFAIYTITCFLLLMLFINGNSGFVQGRAEPGPDGKARPPVNGSIFGKRSSASELSPPNGSIFGKRVSVSELSPPNGSIFGKRVSVSELSPPNGSIFGKRVSASELAPPNGSIFGKRVSESDFGLSEGWTANSGTQRSNSFKSFCDNAWDTCSPYYTANNDPIQE